MLNLISKIAAAFVSNHHIEPEQIAELIGTIKSALSNAAAPVVEIAQAQRPAVSAKKSIRPDAIICMECGSDQQMLKRHLRTAHDLTVDEYKAKWSLPADYPMVAPNYAARRSQLAKDAGLGRKPGPSKEKVETKAASAGHRYPASRWSKPG